MPILNIEIKAKSTNQDKIRRILSVHNAVSKGTDHQIDTYFNVKQGRLKLREGNIENNLIHYHREDKEGPKQSIVTLYQPSPDSTLKTILKNVIGILTIVDKTREIYFIDNVKFHIDTVKDLGTFIEIEAIDKDGSIGEVTLQKQCQDYMQLFEIAQSDLLAQSYSDMMILKNS
jgi:predicted adenylyl cyclase CyaB